MRTGVPPEPAVQVNELGDRAMDMWRLEHFHKLQNSNESFSLSEIDHAACL